MWYRPCNHAAYTFCIIGVGIGVAVVVVTAIVLCGTAIHKQCSNKAR